MKKKEGRSVNREKGDKKEIKKNRMNGSIHFLFFLSKERRREEINDESTSFLLLLLVPHSFSIREKKIKRKGIRTLLFSNFFPVLTRKRERGKRGKKNGLLRNFKENDFAFRFLSSQFHDRSLRSENTIIMIRISYSKGICGAISLVCVV